MLYHFVALRSLVFERVAGGGGGGGGSQGPNQGLFFLVERSGRDGSHICKYVRKIFSLPGCVKAYVRMKPKDIERITLLLSF